MTTRIADSRRPRASIRTASQPGAIGIIEVCGSCESLDALIRSLCNCVLPQPGQIRLVSFASIDHGLLARIGDDCVQLMPHGGPRVMQALAARVAKAGVEMHSDGDHQDWPWPEARDDVEQKMLNAIARAQSPDAIDLLMRQPARWRAFSDEWTDVDEQRSRRLRHLIDPPIVVLAGPANVGKSTLSNALLGRSMSIAIDMPGTTRDYTAGRIDLGGLVVWWHDTPGIRKSNDPVEQESIRLAMTLMHRADLLIAMTDHESGNPWPELPREPDLRIANKADLSTPLRDDADLCISALDGTGVRPVLGAAGRLPHQYHSIANLVQRIREALVPQADIDNERPWRFDPAVVAENA